MDLSESESRKGGEMEIHHFSHQHPLELIREESFASETAYCFGCDQSLEGPRYGCNECKYFLHKRCAELKLDPLIVHPFHPQHLLTLLPKVSYEGACDLCHRGCRGIVYHCDCNSFDLHVNCALLQPSVAVNFPTCLHQHPLFFVENHNEEVKRDCSGCKKPLSGPIYLCSYCPYPTFFNLHKECAELPLKADHPYDSKHPLSLMPKPPTHPRECTCYLCKIQWRGFVYCCSLCKIELTVDDFSAQRTITVASHEHPWRLLLRRMSFTCDFCGIVGDHTPYLCITCDLVVHKKCISMPHNIMITRHHHIISHSYSLPQNEVGDWMCRICHEDVDTSYGSYYCSASDCDYVAHVHCATNEEIWDGKIVLEDNDEGCKEALHESLNMITAVVQQMSTGEQMVAIEIKHAFHDHSLRLIFRGEIEDDDDSQCDGCMSLMSTPFYSCDECKFFLHKDCAELPREKRHPFHKHVLTLTNSSLNPVDGYSICYGCSRPYHGFSYRCNNEDCRSYFNWDIRCISLSDTLEHPSHEHSLFIVHNSPTYCRGCLGVIRQDKVAYKCMKRCNFTLDVECVTQPLTAWYKHDRHPLTLSYSDDSSFSQLYCDLCENERDPNDWFYYCLDCDNSLHSRCALGGPRFMKPGSKVKFSNKHPHPFTVVKNIWNCPRCMKCSNLCSGPVLECKESKCSFTIHYECLRFL